MSEESVYLSGVQFNNSKLLRGYFFRNRFGEAYGLTNPPDETIDRVNAGLHLDSVFDRHKHLLDPRIEHFIGILWTNGKGTGGRMIDLFGFTQEKNWPGNPEVYNWVFRNGGYIPGSVAVTCSNGWRTIANELDYREAIDREGFMTNFPPKEEERFAIPPIRTR